MRFLARVLVLFLIMSTFNGCFVLRWFGVDDAVEEVKGLTDKEIQDKVNSYKKTLLTSSAIQLESPAGGIFNISLTNQENSGILVSYLGGPNCAKYCWTQVMRESIDGVVVKEHTKIPGGENPDAGWKTEREEQEQKQTEEGYVVDGLCNPGFIGNSYKDNPNFPYSDFENNKINPNAKLFIIEFEVCVKCDNPQSDYFACFNWLYIRIKDDGAAKTYLVTENAAKDRPSKEFADAVQKWNSP